MRCSFSHCFFLLLLLCAAEPGSVAQRIGTFDFLTYNVAGLPAFLSDNGVPGNKETNAGTIGTKLAEGAYDVVHLQEDFNYHKQIYQADNHPYRTSTSGGVPFGSGLNTVANFNWTTLSRVKWDKCFINEADCLTPKGFSMMRVLIAEGLEVDFYNAHADAGDDPQDGTARRSGIRQILNYIHSHSQSRAIIIGGDLNDRYTSADRSVDLLIAAGFTDTWVEMIKGGVYPSAGSLPDPCSIPPASNECEVVDKVLYRSSNLVKLAPIAWSYQSDFFVQPDGNKLSDHNPIRVEYAWSAA